MLIMSFSSLCHFRQITSMPTMTVALTHIFMISNSLTVDALNAAGFAVDLECHVTADHENSHMLFRVPYATRSAAAILRPEIGRKRRIRSPPPRCHAVAGCVTCQDQMAHPTLRWW
jgi:hypothetical protein